MKRDVVDRAQALWDEGCQWPDLVATLRGDGYTKLDCMRAAATVLRVPLGDAKPLVHFSDAWTDARDDDDQFHTALEMAAGRLATPAAEAERAEQRHSRLDDRELAQELVAAVTALRAGAVEESRRIVAELLEATSPDRVILFSGALTAVLADMAEIGHENLLAALGILIADVNESSGANTTEALHRAERLLAAG